MFESVGRDRMSRINTLKNIAMALGVMSGLIEIYIAYTAAPEVTRSSDYAGFMLLIIPLGIIAGALAIRFYRESHVGAGIVLMSIAIQHILLQIKPLYFLPIVLAGLAVAIGVYVDDARREAARSHR
jgi:hypothetical protein